MLEIKGLDTSTRERERERDELGSSLDFCNYLGWSVCLESSKACGVFAFKTEGRK